MALVEKVIKDNLIADNAQPITTQTVVIAAGEGKLKRGAVLAMNDSNKCELLDGDNTGKAEFILTEDVDATDADVVAEVYNSGDFFANYVATGADYTLTTVDRHVLKDAGIRLINGLEY